MIMNNLPANHPRLNICIDNCNNTGNSGKNSKTKIKMLTTCWESVDEKVIT